MASNFDRLAQRLAQQKGVTDPRALAASIGRKKYSPSIMAKAASRGLPAATVAKRRG